MIECKRFNASFLKPDTCIGMQAEIVRLSKRVKESKNGGKRIIGEESTRLTRALRCEGCETGLALYQESLKGEDMETKTCPCGKEFTRKPEQSQQAWSRSKYCPKHSEMDPYSRSKELTRIADAKAKAVDGAEPEAKEATTPGPTPIKRPTLEEVGKAIDEIEHPRGKVLETAQKIINGERQDSYGNPEDSFRTIGDYWTTYLRAQGTEVKLSPRQVAEMMMLLKIARMSGQKPKVDNYVDLAGYAGIAGDMVGAA